MISFCTFFSIQLPELSIDSKPEISVSDFKERAERLLSSGGKDLVDDLFLLVDLHNLRAVWQGAPFVDWGKYRSAQAIEQAILNHEYYPEYVWDHIEEFPRPMEAARHFYRLMARYYQDLLHSSSLFLREYANFERRLRIELVGFRSAIAGRLSTRELDSEDALDPDVSHVLRQSGAERFLPSEDFFWLIDIMQSAAADPIGAAKKIEEYRIAFLSNLVHDRVFSVDYLLSYAIRLTYIERWQSLSSTRGFELVLEKVSGH